jgi:two-component system OmpR family response regulator
MLGPVQAAMEEVVELRARYGALEGAVSRSMSHYRQAKHSMLNFGRAKVSREERLGIMRILLVEDDAEAACILAHDFREHGWTVDCVADGTTGLALARSGSYGVLVVDRLLPQLGGIELVKALRDGGLSTPVLFLTARAGVADRVEGFEAGADDYLCKPFAIEELIARVRALARRPLHSHSEPAVLRVADLELNLTQRTATRAGRRIDLQPREFRLLEYLMRHMDLPATRAMLLDAVWGFNFDPGTTVVETHISRLRMKVDRPFDIDLIHTVRGNGYVLRRPA